MRDKGGATPDEHAHRTGVHFPFSEIFKDGRTYDMRWTALPGGHRALSEARRTNDVVLKHFHRRIDLVRLEFAPNEDTAAHLRRGLEVPPIAQGLDSTIKAWIDPRPAEPIADVMVGATKVGTATLPEWAWQVLLVEADRGVYSDGMLSLRPSQSPHDIAAELWCYLPRK